MVMPPTHSVYLLIDPRTNQPFYVGLTLNPEMRLKQHCVNKRKRGKNAKPLTSTAQYIRDMKNRGCNPYLIIVEQVTTFDLNIAHSLEFAWIHRMLSLGYELKNSRTQQFRFYGVTDEPYFFDEEGRVIRSPDFKQRIIEKSRIIPFYH